jgi:flavin-dependent dehydrogenase
MVGIKTYLELRPEARSDLQDAVDVVFFPGGYCGFQAVEGGRVNACLAAGQHVLEDCGGDPMTVFREVARQSSHARFLLDGARFLLDRPLAVGRVPYGMVREVSDGPYFVGDQAAVIPSFCGEGMGLALRSGRLAAEAILRGDDAVTFQQRFAALSRTRVALAARASRALARPRPQSAAAGLARLAPFLVSALASATRTPGSPVGRGEAA